MTAALTSMGAVAFGPWFQVARDINIGLLFVIGVSALAPSASSSAAGLPTIIIRSSARFAVRAAHQL